MYRIFEIFGAVKGFLYVGANIHIIVDSHFLTFIR